MNKLYNKIYEAVNNGIQKALIISNDQSYDTSVKFHNKEISTELIPYEYRFIDMGTGVLWAEYNLGAVPGNILEDWYGDYYAWGETELKSVYSWKSYNVDLDNLKKYYTDCNQDDIMLNPENDIITKKLGGQYRMPSKKDLNNLLENTTYRWIENYNGISGLNGVRFTSRINGKELFFPAAGLFRKDELNHSGTMGCIWSSSIYDINTDEAYNLSFGAFVSGIYHNQCYNGLSIRAVKVPFIKK